ncbi:cytochrome P450 [Kitasatospora sp. NPDC059646]|uniref:cytochrome P450 n=1 Tax=Kitasatospora sp. NPDC059646 TaxID=3346893 RepID=UPI003681E5E2
MSVPLTQLPPLHALDLPDPGPPRPTTLRDGTPAWLVTRYHDARQVLTDPRFRRTRPPGGAGGGGAAGEDADVPGVAGGSDGGGAALRGVVGGSDGEGAAVRGIVGGSDGRGAAGGGVVGGSDGRGAAVRGIVGGSVPGEGALGGAGGGARPDGALNVSTDPASVYNQDGTDHQRLRRTAQGAFTPRAVAQWRPWVETVVGRLLDDLVAAGPPADLVADLTSVLPFAVTSRLMGLDGLGRERLQQWAHCLTADATVPAEQVAAGQQEFAAFAATLLADRRRRPGEDLVSRLVQAADRAGGIPEEQLTYLVGGLAASGSDSVAGALANSLLYLLTERPDAWPRLAEEEPARHATEWLLHHIQVGDDEFTTRHAVDTAEIAGVRIPAGSTVAVCLGSANRDPALFPASPDLFAPLPAPTLAFGAGPHHCLGTWLARTQIHTALHRLATRLPTLHLATPTAPTQWRLGATTRSPRTLRVTW